MDHTEFETGLEASSEPTARTPILAIVGRPNVGKSTLFNRYAGHRRALVADIPGLTRDRIAEEIEIEGRRIWIVDTAGLDRGAADELGAAVQGQARAAVEEADAILFVVDGKHGLLPEDEEIARLLRRTDKPLALAINKIDVPSHADRIHEFHSLGLGDLHAMSAEHGTGTFEALEHLVRQLPAAEPREAVEDTAIRIALAGRPNVGKSSLVNRLAGEERVTVSEVAGTTRDSIDVRIEHAEREGAAPQTFVLVDTAGLRRAARRAEHVERGSALMTLRSLERADVALILIDAADGVGDQDARVTNLVLDRGCAAVIVLNKWDLVDAEQGKQVREEVEHTLRFASHYPIVSVSALTGARLTRLWPAIAQVNAAAQRRISTGELNRWLSETVAKHPPAMGSSRGGRRPMKFFYATQTGIRPPTFALFCTDPDAILPSYKRFLENRLRESFDFAGTPIKLRLRARSGK